MTGSSTTSRRREQWLVRGTIVFPAADRLLGTIRPGRLLGPHTSYNYHLPFPTHSKRSLQFTSIYWLVQAGQEAGQPPGAAH